MPHFATKQESADSRRCRARRLAGRDPSPVSPGGRRRVGTALRGPPGPRDRSHQRKPVSLPERRGPRRPAVRLGFGPACDRGPGDAPAGALDKHGRGESREAEPEASEGTNAKS